MKATMKRTKTMLAALLVLLSLSVFSQKTLCTATTIDGDEYSIIDVGSSRPEIVMMQTYYEWESDKWNHYVTFKDLYRVEKQLEDGLVRSKADNYKDFDKDIYSFKVTNLESFISSSYVEVVILNNGAYITIKFTAYTKQGGTFADLHTATFTLSEYKKIPDALK